MGGSGSLRGAEGTDFTTALSPVGSLFGNIAARPRDLRQCSVDTDCIEVQPELDCPFGSSCGETIASANVSAFAEGVEQINADFCSGEFWCPGHGDCFPVAPACRDGVCERTMSVPPPAPNDDAGS